MYHMSCVIFEEKNYKMVELVVGGSVINSLPRFFYIQLFSSSNNNNDIILLLNVSNF